MIYRTDNYKKSQINPATGQVYDDTWMVYCLTDSDAYKMLVGSQIIPYTVKVSKHQPQWEMSVCDFLQFQTSRQKNIILSMTQSDLENAQKIYDGHRFDDPFLRKYEPDVLVHTTTYENWKSIEKDQCLKCWNILKNEKPNWEKSPIGQRLADPDDFRNFIMLSDGSPASETIVLSKNCGKIITNQDTPYITGARLYFDSKKLACDGLLIRDGIHFQVLNELALKPYLLWAATWETVGLKSSISTPKEFAEKSNQMFDHLFRKNT